MINNWAIFSWLENPIRNISINSLKPKVRILHIISYNLYVTWIYWDFISGRDKQDILVGDFIDHYQNLTLKSMLGIQWFNNECDRSDNFMRKVFISNLYRCWWHFCYGGANLTRKCRWHQKCHLMYLSSLKSLLKYRRWRLSETRSNIELYKK